MAKILIIDDDDNIRNIFKRFLERHGHVVIDAANGQVGLQLLESTSPELVITDIMMPETDGLEVVMAMRNMPRQTPVIAISGGMHAMPTDFLLIAKKFGARKVLYKPFELKELLITVNDVFAEAAIIA